MHVWCELIIPQSIFRLRFVVVLGGLKSFRDYFSGLNGYSGYSARYKPLCAAIIACVFLLAQPSRSAGISRVALSFP